MSTLIQLDDRKVHAERAGFGEIVRYEVAGKWYYEPYSGKRRPLSVRDAAVVALSWLANGGVVHFGTLGGRTFDRIVRGKA